MGVAITHFHLEDSMRAIRLLLWPFTLLLKPILPFFRQLVDMWIGESAQRRRRSQKLATTLLHELGRLGFTKKIRTRKRTTVQRVKFEYPLLMTPDELWCPIALNRLPTGVR